MELIKRNIHMDRVKRSTVIQFTMEEDLNLPEDKPDISTLNLSLIHISEPTRPY